MSEDARESLARIAASLKAYLEFHEDSGSVGFPRRARGAAPPASAAAPPASPPAAAAPPAAPPPSAPAAAPVDAAPPAEKIAPPEVKWPDAPSAAAPARAPAASTATTTMRASAELTIPSAPAERRARLDVLQTEVASCRKCGLAETRTQTVYARGNPQAKLCFVGEAPGADEDEQGLPFVGRAGQLLDKMIGAMGLSPENDVYVCNIIKCRPPGNRRPTPEETEACIPYLHEQLALVEPRVIVALGNTAVGTLLGTSLGISKIRGQWKLYKGTTLVMPTYHPSYLLRPSPQQGEAKREAWEDLQAVMKELGLSLPKRG